MLNGGTAFLRGNHPESRKLKQVCGIIFLILNLKNSKVHGSVENLKFIKITFSMLYLTRLFINFVMVSFLFYADIGYEEVTKVFILQKNQQGTSSAPFPVHVQGVGEHTLITLRS